MYRISVIIPIYNSAKWLNRLINTIKHQSCFENLEVIFVNDGSTDNSLEILNSYNEKNFVVINKKNEGVSAARNDGIKRATCKYIAFVDSDDMIDDNYFEMFLQGMKSDYDLLLSGYIAEFENGKTNIKKYESHELIGTENILKDFLLGKIDPNCWNKLFKKEMFEKNLFDCSMALGEDRDMLFRYLTNCDKIFFNDFARYHYNINNESVMRKGFNEKSIETIEKSEIRVKLIEEKYPDILDYAISCDIDTKCRVLCGIYQFKQNKKYKELCIELKRNIRKYSVINKKKYSNKKHFLAFLLVRISPRLYVFFKDNMKMQYK